MAAAVTVSALLTGIPAQARTQSTASPGRATWKTPVLKQSAQPVAAAQATPEAPIELPERRTERSDTFDLGNGTYQTKSYAGPINYKVGDAWQPIDNAMVPVAGGWQNVAGPYKLFAPSDASVPVTLAQGDASISMQLVGGTGDGQANGPAVSYADALPGVTVRYASNGVGVEQTATLTSRLAQGTLPFVVNLSQGLTLRAAAASGGLEVTDVGGNVVMTVPAPDAVDAAGREGRASLSLDVQADGSAVVSVIVDAKWLADPARAFPITVDPSVNLAATKDCHIVSGINANNNFCGQILEIGFFSSTGIRRAMLQFDLTSVPSYSRVFDADLQMHRDTGFSTNSMVVDAKMLSAQTWTSATTWNKYDGVTAWTHAGGNCFWDDKNTNRDCGTQSSSTGSKVFASVTDAGTSATTNYDIARMAQRWVNAPNMNDGVMLKPHTETTSGTLRYYNAASTLGTPPQLTVTYGVPSGAHHSDTTVDRTLNDRTTLHANVVTGNLLIQAADVHITGVGIDYNLPHVYNSKGFTGVFGPGWTGGPLDERLDVYTDSLGNQQAVAFTDQSGYKSAFLKVNSTGFVTDCASGPDSSSWCPPPGLDATLANPSGNTWTLTYHQSGEKLTFTIPTNQSSLLLTSDEDRNGNKLSYNWTFNTSAVPTQVTVSNSWDVSTNKVTVTFSSGLVDHITDWASRTWQYAYTSGLLTSYTDPNSKVSHYVYDASNNLQEIDTPGTTTLTSIATSGKIQSFQQVVSTGPITGPTTTFTIPAPDADGKGTTTVSDPESHNTTYAWRAIGKVDDVTDADGNDRSNTWSEDDQIAKVTAAQSGGGTASDAGTFNWNPAIGNGNLNSYVSPDGAQTSFSYGTGAAEYQPSSTLNALGNTMSYAYDANRNLFTSKTVASGSGPTWTENHQNAARTTCTNAFPGQLCSTTDAKGNSTSYSYDSTGKITGITYPSPLGAWTVVQDALYRNSAVTDGLSQKRTFIYDPIDRIDKLELNGATGCTPSTGKCVDYGYDADGNQISIQDANGTTTLSYDPLNRLKNQTQGIDGSKADYTYYDDSTLHTVTDTAFTQTYTVTYTYDNANNLTKVHDVGGDITIGLSTDGHENRSTIAYPNGVTVALNPGLGGQPHEIKTTGASTNFDTKYCYYFDSSTNAPACTPNLNTTHKGTLLQSQDVTASTTTNYVYTLPTSTTTASGQLCMVYNGTYSGSNTCTTTGLSNEYRYAYDLNGNMTSAATPSASTFYGYNNANELCRSDTATVSSCTGTGTTYSYDGVGNLTGSTPAGWSATFNTNNDVQTKTAATPTDSISSMQYIGATQDQRVTAGSHNYLNGANLGGVPTIDADQNTAGTTEFFTRTPDGILLAEDVSGGSGTGHFYYTLDNLNSIRQVTNSSGTVTATYTYDPYGNTTSAAPPSTVHNPYGYASGYVDKTGLIKFGARYYAPSLQRWTQQDPMSGLSSAPLTRNRYLYASGDPVDRTDATGATSVLGAFGAIGAVLAASGLYDVAAEALVYASASFIAGATAAGVGLAILGGVLLVATVGLLVLGFYLAYY
ncbi:MAG: RHS repeat-associated core domain-containing protein [Actinomycetales bacterium]